MKPIWDEAKRTSNLAKHGADFAIIQPRHFDNAVVRGDTRLDYGEVRLLALMPIQGRLYVLVFTVETRALRVISLRKASNKEIETYEREA